MDADSPDLVFYQKIAKQYNEAFADIDFIRLPTEEKGYFSNYQSYSVYLKENCPISRNELMQKMLDAGVATRRGIMTAHRETAYHEECAGLSLPVSEGAADNSIILPLYVPMSSEDVKQVIETFKANILVPVA